MECCLGRAYIGAGASERSAHIHVDVHEYSKGLRWQDRVACLERNQRQIHRGERIEIVRGSRTTHFSRNLPMLLRLHPVTAAAAFVFASLALPTEPRGPVTRSIAVSPADSTAL